ncbi:Glycoside hydrolase family 5 protein [Ceratobasidium theobromae]|uniref:cellulase n=1 Tax=Ceratobasidium theobromae TaxID=1582974 RepID=A0A5N5Q9E9_9AGAM|nr:Glycoside hydrolase family 5 protein [Ceratobasidium theobromae]
MKYTVHVVPVLAAAGYAAAQQALYAQCGGIGWTGGTTCVSGATCTYVNDWYSQCLAGTATTTTATSTSTSAAASSTGICSSSTRTKFKYFGVNQSCAEFGQTQWPGVLGTDYTWPTTDSIDYFLGKGMNTFRVAFLMERISPPANGLTGAFDATYLASLKSTVSYITGKGGYAVIDPHNFMRYNNGIITSTSDFQTWWTNLASQFKSDSKVIFDIQNEPWGIDASVVAQLNQVAINGIRAAGATSQLILVEGTSWTGAWTWTSSGNSAAFTGLTDPNNNFAIEMHQYLDSDGSGTSATCVSSTIMAERISAATAWLKANNLKGFLGELGGGSNDVCIAAIKGGLCAMQESGVWIGALWWAAGPWWGDYFQSIEPPSGAAVARILPEALLPFL